MADKYEFLDKMQEDIDNYKAKISRMQEILRKKEQRYKEAKAARMVADINEVELSPKQLGEVLALVKQGKLQAILNEDVSVKEATDIEIMEEEDEE